MVPELEAKGRMSEAPRFLLDNGIMRQLAAVDSSYGQCATDGRLAVFVDYRRGQPLSVQVVRMGGAMSFKIHLTEADSA